MVRGPLFSRKVPDVVDKIFTDKLASAAPTPGGGGASAYAGALAAALSSMVCNLTLGKPAFASVDDELRHILGRVESCREDLLNLIDGDAQAFDAIAAAWKMPKETPDQKLDRNKATQKALVSACEVPLQIMRICAKVIELDGFLVNNSSKLALSDVGASAILAKGALQAAALNVYINTTLMDNETQARAYEFEADDLARNFTLKADEIYDAVNARIRR